MPVSFVTFFLFCNYETFSGKGRLGCYAVLEMENFCEIITLTLFPKLWPFIEKSFMHLGWEVTRQVLHPFLLQVLKQHQFVSCLLGVMWPFHAATQCHVHWWKLLFVFKWLILMITSQFSFWLVHVFSFPFLIKYPMGNCSVHIFALGWESKRNSWRLKIGYHFVVECPEYETEDVTRCFLCDVLHD